MNAMFLVDVSETYRHKYRQKEKCLLLNAGWQVRRVVENINGQLSRFERAEIAPFLGILDLASEIVLSTKNGSTASALVKGALDP